MMLMLLVDEDTFLAEQEEWKQVEFKTIHVFNFVGMFNVLKLPDIAVSKIIENETNNQVEKLCYE